MANIKDALDARQQGYSQVSRSGLPLVLRQNPSIQDIQDIVRELARVFNGKVAQDVIFGGQQIHLPIEGNPTLVEFTTECQVNAYKDPDQEEETFRQSDFVSALIGVAQLIATKVKDYAGDLDSFKTDATTLKIFNDWSDYNYENGSDGNKYINELRFGRHIVKIQLLLQTVIAENNRLFGDVIELKEEQKVEEKKPQETETKSTLDLDSAKVPDKQPEPEASGNTDEEIKDPLQDKTKQTTLSDDQINQKTRYETQWLYNFTLHQIAIQLGIPPEQISQEQRDAIFGEVQKYLRNPANLAKLYDLKNADLNRLNAFKDLVRNIRVIKVADKEVALNLTAPDSADTNASIPTLLKTVLGQEAATRFESILPKNIIDNINQQLEMAVSLAGVNAGQTLTLSQIIFYIEDELKKANITLSSDQQQLLERLLRSYINLRVQERILDTKNETFEKGIATGDKYDPYVIMTRKFGHGSVQTALTDKTDDLKKRPEDELLATAEKSAAGSLNQKAYAQYKKLYGWWYGLSPEVQAIIIKELEKDKSFIATRDPRDKTKYLLPYNINLFNLAALPALVDKHKLNKEFNQAAYDTALKSSASVEEQRVAFLLQQQFSYEYLKELSPEYRVALLAYIKEQKQLAIQAELTFLQEFAVEEAVFAEQQQLYLEQLAALEQAELEDFRFATLQAHDELAYQQYIADQAAFMGAYAPEAIQPGTNAGRIFNRRPVPSPADRSKRAVNTVANKIKSAKDLASAATKIAATGGVAAVTEYFTNKEYRKKVNQIIATMGVGGVAGAIIAYLLKGLQGLAAFGGAVGGALTGAAIGLAIPVVGPIVGAIVGGVLGGMGGWVWGGNAFGTAGGLLGGGGGTAISASAITPTASLPAVAESLGTTVTGGGTAAATATTAATTATATGTAAAVATTGIVSATAFFAPVIALSCIVGISLYTVFVIQWAFLAPVPIGTPLTSQPTFSQYVTVTKIAAPATFDDFTPQQTTTPEKVNYTITITPKAQYQIELGEMKDQFSFLGKSGEMIAPRVETLNSDNQHEISIEDFSNIPETNRLRTSTSATYSINLYNVNNGQLAKDVLINNSFSLTFKVYDAQGKFIDTDTVTANGRVIIGDPAIDGCWPVSGIITQLPFNTYSHSRSDAYDIDSGDGGADEPIYTPFSGEACSKYHTIGYGNHISLQTDGGFTFIFAHMSEVNIPVNTCQRVEAGTPLGAVGATGGNWAAHLHYELNANSAGKRLKEFVPPGTGNAVNEEVISCYY